VSEIAIILNRLHLFSSVQTELVELQRQSEQAATAITSARELEVENSSLTRNLVPHLSFLGFVFLMAYAQAVIKIQFSDLERDLKFEKEKSTALQRQVIEAQDELEKVGVHLTM
jgi:hypothetical protein